MATRNPAFAPDEESSVDENVNHRTVPVEVDTPVHAAEDARAKPSSDSAKEDNPNNAMIYGVEDTPPWYLSILLGLQHYLAMVGATIAVPFILFPALCIEPTNPGRVYILSTVFFMCGIATFLQVTFGVRIPIVQGATFSLLAPTLALLKTQFPACSSYNMSNMTLEEQDEVWMSRLREVQGSIIVASLFEIIVGFSGIIGVLVSVITPLAIAPTVCLVGLSLIDAASQEASTHWGIAAVTMILMILFSQYLKNIGLPLPSYDRKYGFKVIYVKIFSLFPVLLSVLLSWALCAILTEAGVFDEDSKARTDTASEIINTSPWFRVPYPGQWGAPTVSVAGVLGMLAGLMASIVESIGDYYACARLSRAPPPPRDAINRGIGMEGVGSLLAGLWGSGNGTTSYAENIGAIGLTKVASRRVIQYGAVIMILVAVFTKLSAVFVSIPNPVVGGMYCVMFGMAAAVGISNTQFVDMNSSRNIFILGFAIFFGLSLPRWMADNPDALQSESYPTLSQIASVLLRTPMFVGGFIGIVLDNTVPGTLEERGLVKWRAQLIQSSDESETDVRYCYDLPFGMDLIRRTPWLSKVPFCPTFKGWTIKCCKKK